MKQFDDAYIVVVKYLTLSNNVCQNKIPHNVLKSKLVGKLSDCHSLCHCNSAFIARLPALPVQSEFLLNKNCKFAVNQSAIQSRLDCWVCYCVLHYLVPTCQTRLLLLSFSFALMKKECMVTMMCSKNLTSIRRKVQLTKSVSLASSQ